jgi:hypothetical protein
LLSRVIRELADGIQIWHRLGVRLVYSEPPSPYSPGTFSFTIEHPDLSSAMAAPGNALTAEFRAVTCALDVSTRVTEYQLVEDKPKGHPRKSQKKKKQAFTLGLDDDEDCCNLGLDDRMAIDRFISSFDGIREGSPKSAVGLKRKRVEKVTPVTDIISARGLFEAAVEILLFGGTRRCIGFKVLEGESLTGLVHLAPGVFHIPYLTVSDPMPPFSLKNLQSAKILYRECRNVLGLSRPWRHHWHEWQTQSRRD